MSAWQRKWLLIWGTTSPEFSKKYYETVCTGAIDGETGKLVRIYPVTLRYMAEPFGLYRWIEAEVVRNTSDFRPESYKIKQDSITLGESIGTEGDGWERRAQLVLQPSNVYSSVESLRARQERDRTSLGLVKPKKIKRIYTKRRDPAERVEWEQKRDEAMLQKDFLVDVESTVKELTFIPIEYRVEFGCDDPACPGHDMSILDWGTYQLGRKGFADGGAEKANRWVKQKLQEILDPTTRESYLFLGNTKAHPQNFMIVGFFYPPRQRQSLLLG
jgi:hypothetical protein